MDLAELILWISLACVAYTTLGYPLLLQVCAALVRSTPGHPLPVPSSVSIVMAVHNEQERIGARLVELRERLAESGLEGEILVVSDGSTDATVKLARTHEGPHLRVLELPAREGKAAALNAGCAAATAEIVVFVDVRQTLAPTALPRLRARFIDSRVGAVSGELVIEESPGVLRGVGWYWRLEKWLRSTESRVHSVVGVTGAISAVRRELYQPIPAGTLLDDVYWPLRVVMCGHRVVYERGACAFDRLPTQARHEFRRKVRTLAGNYQLMTLLPSAVLPWRNPVWWQFLSHKILRLAVPWALVAAFIAGAFLEQPAYRLMFAGQVLFYAVAVAGLWPWRTHTARLPAAAASFVLLNAAAWVAFWVWITGRTDTIWNTRAIGPRAN